jgi:hypothetical protein
VSDTGSRCDELIGILNSVRSRYGRDYHDRVTFLTTALQNLHRRQGLGFTVNG